MSVANHKKTSTEIVRNSLVVESVNIIGHVKPKVVILENVSAFLKTECTDNDGTNKSIGQMIHENLGKHYSIHADIINFKNYGACSSRTRSIVIAVRKDMADFFSPIELFPAYKKEQTLRKVIGDFKSLKQFAEIDEEDIFHAFRPYPGHMREWISEVREGESAFDNKDISRIPQRVEHGEIVYNKNKNGDKYKRQYWDKVGPCIHTRNDQLASQNTIHPEDDRVFSIRELMRMMTIPDTFKWLEPELLELNKLTYDEKSALLKKEETKIRQSIGEAVPTEIFRSIAEHIRLFLEKNNLSNAEVKAEIEQHNLGVPDNLVVYIQTNPLNINYSSLCRIAELSNSKRVENAAFFTNKTLISEMVSELPKINSDSIHILEPSVGAGNFIPLITRKYENVGNIYIDVVDIDADSLRILKSLLCHVAFRQRVVINYIHADFLKLNIEKSYDIVVGNPPFDKLSGKSQLLKEYKKNVYNNETNNIASFFLEKALSIASYVALVMPKFLLNTPEFTLTRQLVESMKIDAILDFGEKGFTGVLVETIALCIDTKEMPSKTRIFSLTDGKRIEQKQKYFTDKTFPYWIIYRDDLFDFVTTKIQFNIFDVFRDRQLTNSIVNGNSGIRVIKSRNIDDDGSRLVDIPGYDSYVSSENAEKLSVYKFLERTDVYLTPNMTYKPRVMIKPKGMLVNGSAAVLILKDGQSPLTQEELSYFSSEEYRTFYRTARNYQTRSLNIDSNAVFFFGRLGVSAN